MFEEIKRSQPVQFTHFKVKTIHIDEFSVIRLQHYYT